MTYLHCLIEGKVQGVFYRASTQQQALNLKLNGWVKNRSDGQVELIASGNLTDLQDFEAWLWQGPKYAHVTKVTCEYVDSLTHELHDGFTIS